ncbi:MAG: hypothetical protein ABJC10_10705 [Acidobacteriota bacterium]
MATKDKPTPVLRERQSWLCLIPSPAAAQLTEMLSYSTGEHLIKVGLNIPDLSRRGLENNFNSLGKFYFSSVADYVQQRPYSFLR